ncbi:dTDP-4-dehydrorhamnose reductase [Humidisolicoccus flavus]|uniref:dTDP-4-dehydrorhamnose reductase n=1 Tax=Humidisolicoccus flavus TaxID=3111414 RepID=UPI0032522778
MKILLVGASGMLGSDLREALSEHEVDARSSATLDITDAAACLLAAEHVDVIVNASGYTKVDDAESDEDRAAAINATGVENLARAAHQNGAVLVHVSTDYVFDGAATAPYAEDTAYAPVSAYGRTKALGEQRALAVHPDTIIVRTAWLYGRHGANFAQTMLRLATQHETVNVIDDQRGQPTYAADLAARIVALIDAGVRNGIFHGTNSGETTWFGFAKEIFATAGLDTDRVLPTDSKTFVRAAQRPAYSVLGHDAWTSVDMPPMRHWKEALHDAFQSGALSA